MPPAHTNQTIDVNLLPRDPFTESSLGKFLGWALSIGRYIVVFTELIVILTFISRFTLDRKLTDLNEDLLAQQALLEAYADFEQDVRGIQAKAQFIEQITNQPSTHDMLDFITSNLPSDIVFTQMTFQPNQLSIVARAYSSSSLSQFVDILKSEPQYSDITIDQINTSEQDTAIQFLIRAELNQPEAVVRE